MGNKLTASISGDVGTEFVLQLCPPATTDLATGARVAYSGGSTYPRTLKYSVPLGKAGIYYLNLQAYEGVGNYTLTWEVTQDEPDYNIPGVALPASPVSGTLDENTDRDDIYAIPLQAGQKLLATISGSAGTDFDLWLFAPAATNVNADYYVRIADKKYYPETLVYSVVAGKGGTYYLDVCVYQGTGAYTLDWRVVAAEPDDNVPGVALPPPPVTGGLDEQTDVDDVYYVDLRVGDVLTVTLDREVHSDLFLFGPDSQDVQADEFLLGTVDLETRTKTLSYPVTQAGRYYLDVYLQSGAGTYTLDWRPARNVTHDWPLYE